LDLPFYGNDQEMNPPPIADLRAPHERGDRALADSAPGDRDFRDSGSGHRSFGDPAHGAQRHLTDTDER
jgi:hypothetical protein